MSDRFIQSVQNFVANRFGSGSSRNMGPPGLVKCVREFFRHMDLAAVSRAGRSGYPRRLDRLTRQLCRRMPGDGPKWGPARKFLNLFLRDAVYDYQLRRAYRLRELEKVLELPLDSHVGHRLREEEEGRHLPRWHSVKHLTPEESAEFQAVAARVAKRKRIYRIHLDLSYWRGPAR